MPRAIGIFPSPSPKPQPAAPNAPQQNTGSSSFGNALQTARHGSSSKSSKPAPPQQTTANPVKTPATKGAKPASGKAAAGAGADSSKSAATSTKSPLPDTAAEALQEPTAPTKPATTAKAKSASSSATQSDTLPPTPLANPAFIVHKIGDDAAEEEKAGHGAPEDGDAVEAIGAEDEKDAESENEANAASSQDAHAPPTATQAPAVSPFAFTQAPLASGQQNVGVSVPAPVAAGGNAPSATAVAVAGDAILDSAPLDGSLKSDATANFAPTPQPEQSNFAAALGLAQASPTTAASSAPPAASPPVAPASHSADAQFSAANHASIITNVHAKLLPDGGSMQIRLDPPELGAMNISVHMRDGAMTATFQTSTDQASRLLSHSLGQLKTAIESTGVTVSSLHVQQTPRDAKAGSQDTPNGGDSGANTSTKDQQQEQQRKDMVRRMWKRLNGGKDPLDLVA